MLEQNNMLEPAEKPEIQEKHPQLIDDSKTITLNTAWQFWTNILGSPRHILAPMVDHSELAFRLLVRKYDVHCTYTPMFNSGIFVKDIKYQHDCLQMLPERDTPCIIQFCANNPEVFLEAVKIASPYCNAVDLNLGCPQIIARRGHYGAFLQDEWELIFNILNLACRNSSVPITCKIRVFEDVEKTVRYAKMLESAGVSLITVHGRVREQKGPLTGLADWNQIRAVKEAVKVPVFANGNIQAKSEVDQCFEQTNVDGVMSAEGLLYNPALFTGEPLPVWIAAQQYLELVREYPCPLSYIRGHVFKFFHHCFTLEENFDLREIVSKTHSIDDFLMVAEKLKDRYQKEYELFRYDPNVLSHPKDFPVFFCKPYYRPPPTSFNCNRIDLLPDNNENVEKKIHKKLKNEAKMKQKSKPRRNPLPLCVHCSNPKGLKCDFGRCRNCCKKMIATEKLKCLGHKFGIPRTKDVKPTEENLCNF